MTTTTTGRRRTGRQPDPALKTDARGGVKAPAKEPRNAPKAPPKPKTTAPKATPVKAAPTTQTKTRVADTGAARARVPAARATVRSPRAPFVLLILALLGGALVSLLLLNTVLAKDAFSLTELQQSNKQLQQQSEALKEDIAREQSPANLSQKAKALGMVQPKRPAFLDERTNQIVGTTLRPVPRAAAAAAGAAGVVGVPGAVVPGDGIPGWTGGEPKTSGTGGSR